MSTQKTFTKGSELPALRPGTLRLYSMRFCPYAQRTRLVLEHKKIPHETVNVDLKQKPDWFIERNPLGLVPVLEKDGKVLYESLITSDYLDEVYPNDKLNPDDPYLKARDRIVMELFSKAASEFYNIARKSEGNEGLNNWLTKLDPVEKALAERGDFFGGDKVSMLDYMIWPWVERIDAITTLLKKMKSIEVDVLPVDRFPKLTTWKTNMAALPAVKATMFDVNKHVQFLISSMSGKPDYDMGL